MKQYGDADFFFKQDLAVVHSAKTTSHWFADYGFTVFDWPAYSPDLNPIETMGIVKRKTRHTKLNITNEMKATVCAKVHK